MPLFSLTVFVFGLAIGSFLNSIVFRYNTGESAANGRSRCFNCGRNLSWIELIPILSFLIQRGKCRNCSSKISWQYPAGELLTGILFLAFFIKWQENFFDNTGLLVFWFLISSFLILITLYDIKHKIIPDSFSYSFLALAFLSKFIFFEINLLDLILSLLPALFLFCLWLFSKGRWMGLGDSKLMLGGGIFLGFPGSIYAVLLGFWIGALFGISLLLGSTRITIKSEIPFGPFLVLGIILAFFFPGFFSFLNFFYA
ncbi:hypothetical protein A3H04_00725 [Candidatus Giovannonibacteria bacterium RIFCSPLOWO2_12_FULL_43_11c]|uniref:Prepilin peptidase n=1 Tax=Candidatus Giovannonibacteria bacterium RIFCSPHIGHO2_12_FULL_43_15 TaxID=1798341 RepID=A0A1F5WQ97_9BACT|nr:MAG: hypothetical protein A3B97_01615 [Candidatus Giovannonibacteria bacterium RIFCSPHIGHO2_02_FULL_43_32]OGF77431.1 MAG: hypothetical protein A3F23_01665 [Candidatus Giovannonibacteria bacterium RIFCSPHIGHO2_12_FULL_43_15]OGF92141.1 MAG: hypothetical protein A3H04_00725 [Candidatus Giovannonibacteria bacterium RIFCSPLOWO2_12_FULL_43_11c]